MSTLPHRRPTLAEGRAALADDVELLRTVLAGMTEREMETCAGELLIHADGRTECLDDPRCSTDPALHVGRVGCVDALGGDCCAVV